jgi:hypothetical protein
MKELRASVARYDIAAWGRAVGIGGTKLERTVARSAA